MSRVPALVVVCVLACAREARTVQAVTSAGPPGPAGPVGAVGPQGPVGAVGAAGAFDVLDGSGTAIGPLVTVAFSGAAPVFVLWEGGRFTQLDAYGAPMRSQGLFSEDPSGCTEPWFLPSDSPGRLEADTLSTYVLDAFGPGIDGRIERTAEPERTRELAGYFVAFPDGSTACVPAAMGPAPTIAVELAPQPRRKGPLTLRERR